MATRRKHNLNIRFSDDEWKRVHLVFPKHKVGTIMRALALAQKAPRRSPVLEARRELLLALARIGNNLNQLARAVNTANLAGSKVDTLRVLAKLVEIQEQLENL
jgi:hypothetical protein